jgi:eukaryotic-like serine/threonine-protein kinase
MNGRLRAVALNRRSEPAALIKLIQDDLDWIVLKAIEKDRRRRYDTPAELAADVRRHLADEPVLARPPSAVYQLRKFARRHQALVTATSVIAVMLVLTATFSAWQALRATRAQALAEQQRQEAAQQAAVANAMNEFLTEDLLRQADVCKAEAHASPNRDIRLLEIVNRASEGVSTRFAGQPLVAAKIHLTAGSVYAGLGETEKAEHHLRAAKALYVIHAGTDDPRTLEVDHALAVLLRVNRAAYEETETLIRHVLNVRQRTLGEAHRETISSSIELARLRSFRGAHDDAEELLGDAIRNATLTLGPDHPLTLTARERTIFIIWLRGEKGQAVQMQSEMWNLRKRIQGEAHPETLYTLRILIFYHLSADPDYDALEQMIHEGLVLSRQMLVEFQVADALEQWRAVILSERGLFLESKRIREDLVESVVARYGPEHYEALGAKQHVAFYHARHGGNPIEAIKLLKETLASYRRVAPTSHDAQVNRGWLASLYWRVRHFMPQQPTPTRSRVDPLSRGPRGPSRPEQVRQLAVRQRQRPGFLDCGRRPKRPHDLEHRAPVPGAGVH